MVRQALLIVCLISTLRCISQQNTLSYYLNHAYKNSPLIKDFQNQILSLSYDSLILRASLRPIVTGNSNNSYAPVINGYGYDQAITNMAQVSALITVTKSFIGSKTLSSQIANLGIQGKTAANSIYITQQDLQKAITDQYVTAFGDLLQMSFNKEINQLLRREDSILIKLTQNNVYKQVDYLSFLVTLQQQELMTAQLEVQYNFDVAGLNYLAGITDTSYILLQDPYLQLSGFPDYTTSIFYQQFALDSLRILNQKALIDINYRPKINASADAGFNSTMQVDPHKNFGTSIGLTISVPIYDGRQRKYQYEKLNIAERTRTSKRDFFLMQRQQQILQLRNQLTSTQQLLEKINKQVKYTETLIDVNEKLLATGDIRLTDFILTLNNYFIARNLIAQNYISRMRIINQLNYWGR